MAGAGLNCLLSILVRMKRQPFSCALRITAAAVEADAGIHAGDAISEIAASREVRLEIAVRSGDGLR
jgi:hypothetical protein